MDEFKQNINKLKEDIKTLIDILNSFMKNIEICYNINSDINNSFNIKTINYEILNNIKEINYNNEYLTILKELLMGKILVINLKSYSIFIIL